MKQKKTTTILIGVIILLSCLVVALGGLTFYLVANTPLGESMNLVKSNTAIPVPTAIAGAQATLVPPTDAAAGPSAVPPTATSAATATTAASAAAAAPAAVCGSTGSQTLLFAGSDFSGGVPPRGADAVRLIKVDYSNRKIVVVAFPRDLWVYTPSLSGYGMDQSRLGLSYYYEKTYTPGDTKHRVAAASTLLAQVLYDNFEVESEHYLSLELSNVAQMIDKIGGVEVNLPNRIVSDSRVIFPAGSQVLDGYHSAEFVRTWGPGGEPARIERQNLFVRALQNRVLSANILPQLPDLINQFDQTIFTDLTPAQMVSLACMSKEVPSTEIAFYQVGGDMVRSGSAGVLLPDVAKIKANLQAWLGQ